MTQSLSTWRVYNMASSAQGPWGPSGLHKLFLTTCSLRPAQQPALGWVRASLGSPHHKEASARPRVAQDWLRTGAPSYSSKAVSECSVLGGADEKRTG